MWNSTFKQKQTKPLKKTPFKRKDSPFLHKRSKLRVVGDNDTATLKKEIQALVRLIVTHRDNGCILRHIRHCGGEAMIEDGKIISNNVIQADHLITRGNSATFADTRLIVCLCSRCHTWKSIGNNLRKAEYDEMVRKILPKEIVTLWDRCEADVRSHKTYKPDWKLELLGLKQMLKQYE